MLQEVLTDQLKDLLHAENQLVKALPKMAKAAKDDQLKSAFTDHLEKTKGHVERLKQVFEMLDEPAKAKMCKGMAGLVEEGNEVISEGKELDPVEADLALIAAAQRVEHYEIAAYGTSAKLAEGMGRGDIAELLSQTLDEEKEADQLLTQITQPLLDSAAESDGEDMDMDEEEEEEETVKPARRGR
ncbi:MAG: ferritin-like domain-containing protein [Bryobacterales bacterium]|nr:ferritin-like domain-containing protein [Bryobacterales bacterium]MBV9399168.1 ferritin-like domain-containing protein [Bryobacterales bacterium]